ncbi:hypothetical protein WR25_10593 [Diploscapter pachys]|uniref:J domain-containing protein n=1 Tax=Diploscapter pachys TaxID=2018661 RepID=A0A2A2JFP1_9BILA|nr:hypothetical protein WR25_10593 [Diploscapter pachys]
MTSNGDLQIGDYYELLGIERTAPESDIKSAYRKLALKYHPDRNPNDVHAAEEFKKISIAYSVLIDPNKRRQYDLHGPSANQLDFDGLDLSELGGVGRVFGALFTKLGVPISTQIPPKVLAQARQLCLNEQCEVAAVHLSSGNMISANVGKQQAAFYTISMEPPFHQNGISVICRSTSFSKFKLVLFDRDGAVRMIKESQKKKHFTQADMFFVPFPVANIEEFAPMKHMMEDKETPLPFHYLSTLESQTAQLLDDRLHLLCVYGDNWLNDVKYSITFLPMANESVGTLRNISELEKQLFDKKKDMSQFQRDYMDLKKKFEAAVERLKREDKEIQESLTNREKLYEAAIDQSQAVYSTQVSPSKSSKGLFGWLGGR